MKVLYIQRNGNFAEAYQRLYKDGGVEDYYGQKYSVDAVVQQARRGIDVLVIVLKTHGFREHLESNLSVVGLKRGKTDYGEVGREVDAFKPDRVIVRTPDPLLLRLLRKRSIATLPIFADSFESKSLVRGRLYRYRMSKELKHQTIRYVGNHQMNAAGSLQRLGVNSEKILPYDWEHSDNPMNWSKAVPADIGYKELQIFFAGKIAKIKGVYDVIKAAKCIKAAGRDVTVKIAGKGDDLDDCVAYAKAIGVEKNIVFLGRTPHQEVLKHMNQADLVVVPSHHKYPEGLPMTIMESLMVHTPVIASDHPMFVGRVGNRGAVQFFREKNALHLAQKILALCVDPMKYKAASLHAPLEWNDCNLRLKWADLVNQWIDKPITCNFRENSLAALEAENTGRRLTNVAPDVFPRSTAMEAALAKEVASAPMPTQER